MCIRDSIKRQTEELKTEVVELQERKETAREELERAKKEIQTERLKGAATTAAANIAESVGSLFGSNKVKTLERDNTAVSGKLLEYAGELYSEKHGRKFTTEKAGFQVLKDTTDGTRLVLAIDRKPIAEWFK